MTDARRYDITTIVERNRAAKEHAEDIRWYAERLVQADSFVGERLQKNAAELEAIRFDGEDDGPPGQVQFVSNEFKLDPPPSDPGLPQPPGGWSDDPVMEDAQRIAYGHAWKKHLSDFKGMTQDQLAKLVHDMLTGNPQTDPSLHVGQIPGRSSTAMYKDGIVVIHDPLTGDGGTVYRPTGGFDEFLRLIGGAGAAPIIGAPPNLPPSLPHPAEAPLPQSAPHVPAPLPPPLTADPGGLPPWLANPSLPATPVSPAGPLILPNTPLMPGPGVDLNPGQISAPAATVGAVGLAGILAFLLLAPG